MGQFWVAVDKIDGRMLNRLNHAIERLPHYEIHSVRPFYEGTDEDRQKMPEDTLIALSTAGLARATSGWDALIYIPNEVCTAFVTHDLDKQ